MSHQIVHLRARQTSSRTVRNTNPVCYCNHVVGLSNPTCRCRKTTLDSTTKTTSQHPSRANLRTARLDKFQKQYDHDKEVFKAKEEEKRRKKLEDKLKRYQGVGELGNKMVDSNLTMEEKNDGYWNSRDNFEFQYQNDSIIFLQEQVENEKDAGKEVEQKRVKLEEKLKRYPGIGELGNKMVDSYLTKEGKNEGYVKSRKSFELQCKQDSNCFLLEKSERCERETLESLKEMTIDKAAANVSNVRNLEGNSKSRRASPSSSVLLESANNTVVSSITTHTTNYNSSVFKVVSPGAPCGIVSSALLSQLTDDRSMADRQEPDMNAAVSTKYYMKELSKVVPSGNERLTRMNRACKENPHLQLTKNKPISSDTMKTNNSMVKLSSPDGSVVKTHFGHHKKKVDPSYGKKTGNLSVRNPSLGASDSKLTHGSSLYSVTSPGSLNDKKPGSSMPVALSVDASHGNCNSIIKVVPSNTNNGKKPKGSSVFSVTSPGSLNDKKPGSSMPVDASPGNCNSMIKVAPSNTPDGKKPKGSSVFSVASADSLNEKKPGNSMPIASHSNSNAIISLGTSTPTLSDTSVGCRLGGNIINKVRGEHPLLAKLTNNKLQS